MIPNPENVFESLQNDVATQLMSTSPFSTIAWPDGSAFQVLTEDEGDIQYEYDQQIAQLGLSIVVHAPAGEVSQPDMPGPVITKLGFDVWVSEAPVFNRSEAGTKVRLFKAMAVVIGTLHGFQPEATQSPIYIENFRRERERTYVNDADKVGTLVNSLICHFIVPQVGALITEE
jgi:hypothetical protein